MSRSIVFSSDGEVEEVGLGMFARTLPKARWTHAGHVAAAVWVVMRRAEWKPEVVMPPAIRAYNEATGVANTDSGGYHETITLASLRAVRAFVEAHPGLSPAEMCNALLGTKLGNSGWLLEYWSRERLFSLEARRGWVEPDLAPLPF